ncbi:unnamed protein product [Meloidogyne enterolobii]|uniref:Uncharacterized protein n=1 Tax=Meloidogyne enterolobii TaxID=390850 RepID=A0ACB0ZPF3_MELEN
MCQVCVNSLVKSRAATIELICGDSLNTPSSSSEISMLGSKIIFWFPLFFSSSE